MFTRSESFKEFIRLYPIVSSIIAIHIIIFLLTILPVFPNSWFIEQFSGINLYIWEGQLWRLITPLFMHSGFSHLLFNSFSIVLFGPALERILGRSRFLFVYLTTGVLANVATLLLQPVTYSHVGASGAIFGLFGYYASILIYRKHFFSKENTQLLITITVMAIIMTFIQANINITAHLSGLLVGFLLGAFTYKK
jgi:rhomboid protease GluP